MNFLRRKRKSGQLDEGKKRNIITGNFANVICDSLLSSHPERNSAKITKSKSKYISIFLY